MDQVRALHELIERLVTARFYGELVIKFEQGRVVVVKKTESIKLMEGL